MHTSFISNPDVQQPRDEAWSASVLTQLQQWGRELGFSQIGVSSVDLQGTEDGLLAWLAAGFHGEMHYMSSHGLKRARPHELVPGTVSVITARMNYLPPDLIQPASSSGKAWIAQEWHQLSSTSEAQISVYARGRDYHKVLRARLQQLADRLTEVIGPFGYRAFTDSAPVLEVELAQRSGLGWRGKHTLLLDRQAGSFFFLGELFTDLPLQPTPSTSSHCGSCRACVEVCPTQAIVDDYRLDARRCISYLTIEHAGPIPVVLRELIGNRLYGCDDCQLVCPWNKFAQAAVVADFAHRAVWQDMRLTALWQWRESEFLSRTEGSAIRRIGFERWQRNLAVVSGNALRRHDDAELRRCLEHALPSVSPLVAEHMQWALQRPTQGEGA